VTDGRHPAWTEENRFRGALDDVAIIPLVVITLATNKILRFVLSILMRMLDYAFPLAMQRHGMGVQRMPASHAERRIARDPVRGTLAADLFRGCNGDARGIVCQGRLLASLDATLASARNRHSEEQAFGATGLPGSLAARQKTSIRSARIQGLRNHQVLVCDQKSRPSLSAGRDREFHWRFSSPGTALPPQEGHSL
jgi:hypothetical protein